MEKTVNTHVIQFVSIQHVTALTVAVLLQAEQVFIVENNKPR